MDKDRSERLFIERIRKYPDTFYLAGQDSVMEGFQYYKTDAYRNKPGAITSRPKTIIKNQPLTEVFRLGKHMFKIAPQMFKNIDKSYGDMEALLDNYENQGKLQGTPKSLIQNYPNRALWEELKQYAWDRYKLIVGFTEVPRAYIFKDKGIPFPNALVFAQEMKKEPMEKAPLMDAGMEVVNVYNSLGIAVNEIAHWLRSKHQIVCMANHPLGGLTDTVPLAVKAGLGEFGRSGLLITKEFGPRCRIAPIYIDGKIFQTTDTKDHAWIKDFCKECGKCIKSCPTKAIYEEPHEYLKYNDENIPNRKANYDREKCFTSFSATMGCGVCISVCPFSKNPKGYDKMKSVTLKRRERECYAFTNLL